MEAATCGRKRPGLGNGIAHLVEQVEACRIEAVGGDTAVEGHIAAAAAAAEEEGAVAGQVSLTVLVSEGRSVSLSSRRCNNVNGAYISNIQALAQRTCVSYMVSFVLHRDACQPIASSRNRRAAMGKYVGRRGAVWLKHGTYLGRASSS